MKAQVMYADLSEILFEGRNKKYGGYVLRKQANNNLMKALSVASAFLLLGLLYVKSSTPVPEPQPEILNHLVTTDVKFIELPEKPGHDKQEGAAKPPSPPPSPPEESNESNDFKAVSDEKADPLKTIPSPDSLATASNENLNNGNEFGDPKIAGNGTGIESGTGSGTGTGETGTTDTNKEWKDWELDESPVAENMNAVRSSIKYPKQLLEAGEKGDVLLNILVGKDGGIEKMVVDKSTHPLFSNEVTERAMSLKFRPGKVNGTPVRVWVKIPFRFRVSR